MNCQHTNIGLGDGQRWCSVVFRKDVEEKWVLSPLVEQEEEVLPLRKWGREQRVQAGHVVVSWVARQKAFRKPTRHLLINPAAELRNGALVPGCVEVFRGTAEHALYLDLVEGNPWLPDWLAEVQSTYLPLHAVKEALAYQKTESSVQAALFCAYRGLESWVQSSIQDSCDATGLPWVVETRQDHLKETGPRAKLLGWAGRGRPVLLPASDLEARYGWKEVIEIDFSRRRLVSWAGEQPWRYPGKSLRDAGNYLKKSGILTPAIA